MSLGFKAETDFEDIVRAHIEDELGGNVSWQRFTGDDDHARREL